MLAVGKQMILIDRYTGCQTSTQLQKKRKFKQDLDIEGIRDLSFDRKLLKKKPKLYAEYVVRHIDSIAGDDKEGRRRLALDLVKTEFGAQELVLNIDHYCLDDQKFKEQVVFEISGIKYGPWAVSKHFEKIGITDLKIKKSLALKIAMGKQSIKLLVCSDFGSSKALALNIEKFGFKDTKFLHRLALEILKEHRAEEALISNFEKFHFDQSILEEIIRQGPIYTTRYVAKYIHKMGFDLEFRKKIALMILERGIIDDLASYIDRFDIDDQEFRFQIASRLCENNVCGKNLIENLNKFHFDDEALQQLAFICAERPSAGLLVENLEKFRIKNSNLKNKLVNKIVRAKFGCSKLAAHIEKFDLEDDEKYDLAFKIAEDDYGAAALAQNIKKFPFINMVHRRKLAKKIVKQNNGARAFVENIEQFVFKDLYDFLNRIAEHNEGAKALAANPWEFEFYDDEEVKNLTLKIIQHKKAARILAQKIKIFDFDNEFLKRLASKIVHNEVVEEVIQNLADFGLCDQESLKKIALEMAQYHPYELSRNICMFRFQDSDFLKTLAMQIACTNYGSYMICNCVENFGIKDSQSLRELGDRIMRHSSCYSTLIHYFERYGLADSEFIHNLMLKIKRSPPDSVSDGKAVVKFFIRHCFDDEKTRQECVSANINNEFIACALRERIQEFHFNDPDLMLVLALDMIKSKWGMATLLQSLDQFHFSNQKIKQSLLKARDVVSYTILDPKERKRLFIDFLFNWDRVESSADETKKYCQHFLGDSQHLSVLKRTFNLQLNERPSLKEFNESWKSLFNQMKRQKYPTKPLQYLKSLAVKILPLLKCLDKMESLIDDELQNQLVQWMFYGTCRAFLLLSKEQLELVIQTEIFKILYELRDMDLRYTLIDRFISKLQTLDSKVKRREFLTSTCKSKNTLLVRLLLEKLKARGTEIDDDGAFENSLTTFSKNKLDKDIFYRGKFLHDGNKLIPLLKALLNLEQSRQLESFQIAQCLKYLTRLPDEKLSEELNALHALFILENAGLLVFDLESESPKQIFGILKSAFEQLLPGLELKNSELFEQVFFGKRHPEALLTYIAGFQEWRSVDKDAMTSIIQEFVENIDHGLFQEKRYEGSVHLESVFNSRIGLKEAWKKGRSASFMEYLSKAVPSEGFELAGYLKKKISEGHFPKEMSVNLKDLLDNLIKNPKSLSKKSLRELEEAVCKEGPECEFLNDIRELKRMLSGSMDLNIEEWTLVNSDDPLDLFLSGTEVGGSCQRINGNPNLNKALMGYVMDGKYRIIVIKDEHEIIVGRAVLRLLFDEKRGEPVLFYEQVYPGTLKQEYKDAMAAFTNECARDLGVPVTTKNRDSGMTYYGVLTSYSCKAPFEYCDGGGGLKSGQYIITGSRYLVDPES